MENKKINSALYVYIPFKDTVGKSKTFTFPIVNKMKQLGKKKDKKCKNDKLHKMASVSRKWIFSLIQLYEWYISATGKKGYKKTLD